ncbi:MAG: hypothetical protein LH473_00845 [Chitinophagales bacterium]|nr:hypothetical protein [Chitinophagales bacterium]
MFVRIDMKEIFTKFIIIFLSGYAAFFECSGQSINKQTRIVIIGGIGNYESAYCGVQLSFHQYFIEGAFGVMPWNFNQDRYLMEYLVFGRKLIQPTQNLNVALQLKILQWNYCDDYTRISVLMIAPEIKLSQVINARFKIAAAGGIAYNGVLNYERKTYSEVGWLNRFGPSFNVQLQYWFL